MCQRHQAARRGCRVKAGIVGTGPVGYRGVHGARRIRIWMRGNRTHELLATPDAYAPASRDIAHDRGHESRPRVILVFCRRSLAWPRPRPRPRPRHPLAVCHERIPIAVAPGVLVLRWFLAPSSRGTRHSRQPAVAGAAGTKVPRSPGRQLLPDNCLVPALFICASPPARPPALSTLCLSPPLLVVPLVRRLVLFFSLFFLFFLFSSILSLSSVLFSQPTSPSVDISISQPSIHSSACIRPLVC